MHFHGEFLILKFLALQGALPDPFRFCIRYRRAGVTVGVGGIITCRHGSGDADAALKS